MLISDPARPDSQVEIEIDPSWKRSREVPDSYRLLLALASPAGVQALPGLVDKARLQQTRVTRELRQQARQAIERFVQEVLDHRSNRDSLSSFPDRAALARALWHEGLVIVYRLLFVLHLESNDDQARAFSFASSSLWRNTFSPSVTLARHARALLDQGAFTGRMLEDGLRALFAMLADGLRSSELHVKPLGGALFGSHATPLLTDLAWGDCAVAHLLDQLLWTSPARGGSARRRVHYGPLDVEDLGRVYEALLELEPGIADEPMCRLRRQKLEVVVPLAQGEKYRAAAPPVQQPSTPADDDDEGPPIEQSSGPADENDDAAPKGKTRVEWVEEIPPGRFYLRVGLGRKSTGSYYTPHSFVRFLVQETLGPQVTDRSPQADPRPLAILKLKVLDPAMGSGHFLVEACRFLGDKLYEACRLCDERGLEAERRAERAKDEGARAAAQAEALAWRQRVTDLPDPDDELVRYLPSRAPEGEESGLSQKKAAALCKRLVAVHCLYGVDKNPLAVELAKLALWMESHAEGLPLTFLDHRLVTGDSLTGPFFDHLLTLPGTRKPLDDLFVVGLREKFTEALRVALSHVRDLEATVGVSVAEVEAKEAAKRRLDLALAAFRVVAAAWAGGVMLGPDHCDDLAYQELVRAIAETGTLPARLDDHPRLLAMIARGLGIDQGPADSHEVLELAAAMEAGGGALVPALPYDLAFADVFYPGGRLERCGFDALLGNPPWERIRRMDREFFAGHDVSILSARTKHERARREAELRAGAVLGELYTRYVASFHQLDRSADTLYVAHRAYIEGQLAGRGNYDAYMLFGERALQLRCSGGLCGLVLPSGFHANEGALGVRQLFLTRLRSCYSYENRFKLFEIHSSFKFAIVVAGDERDDSEFGCAFYLVDDRWLFSDALPRSLRYTPAFVRRTSPGHLSLLELRGWDDLDVAQTIFAHSRSFKEALAESNIVLSQELNMTYDSERFVPVETVPGEPLRLRDRATSRRLENRGYLVLHEGKTFWQYDDRWGEPPRFVVGVSSLSDRPYLLRAARHYRLAYRDVASATNERTLVMAMIQPAVFGNSAPSEREPSQRRIVDALGLVATANSFVADWTVRIRAATHVNLFMFEACRSPLASPTAFLVHQAARLTATHEGYEELWHDQLGDVWREPKPPFTWPVLDGDDERWAVRAAIDAVVADAYGLSRDQYAHVLSTFSHKSYPKAPELCLACFDELKETGLQAFTRKHDPYWDIPLNENLPQPVIDLPIPEAPKAAVKEDGLPFEEAGAIVYEPAVETAGLLKAAERSPAYKGKRRRTKGAGR